MHLFSGLLQPEIKRQTAKNIKPAARASDEDIPGFFQLAEKWELHAPPP